MSLEKFWMIHCLMIDCCCYASEVIATALQVFKIIFLLLMCVL